MSTLIGFHSTMRPTQARGRASPKLAAQLKEEQKDVINGATVSSSRFKLTFWNRNRRVVQKASAKFS
jgi:major membrane immunogen (membrane-anchored lipoprotein)